MPRFRKKPVVIEAMQFDGDNGHAILTWMQDQITDYIASDRMMIIKTLEGDMRADVGDWIIRGVQGEFYPCKNEIFLATYESVENEGLQGLRQEEAP